MTLCDPKDCSPAGSSVHGIFQAGTPEWVAMPSSEDLPDPGIESASLKSPALEGGFFTTWARTFPGGFECHLGSPQVGLVTCIWILSWYLLHVYVVCSNNLIYKIVIGHYVMV